MTETGTLLFICGKMGAGKSTLSHKLVTEYRAVLISEDEWLSALYPEQISSFEDYIKHSSLLRPLIKTHVQRILLTGTDVILDFPANTIRQRAWLKNIALEVDTTHQLFFIDASDDRCLKQIAKRRAEQPERAAFDTEEMFYHVIQYFERPTEAEQLHITSVD